MPSICLYGQHGVVYDESSAKTTNIENSNPICKGFVVNPLITKTTYACKVRRRAVVSITCLPR